MMYLACVPLTAAMTPEITLTASAVETTDSRLKYEITDGEICITGYTSGMPSEVVIPAEIEGVPVTSIGSEAFFECGSLTKVTIPDSVTSIGGYAFRYCISLTEITIPDSVTSIGEYAFSNTPWMDAKRKETPLVVVNGILISGYDCSGVVTIPVSVTSIGWAAFRNCSSLTEITIPGSVISIGTLAFYGCRRLTSVEVSESVK